ncbi:glycosyltransferase family 92 protein [Lunatibacter salilacus]|uniref:glycosyltransferase family 92 protein n=1 Tax=Lunatibacter salilacus TaxID=2483804 RepID=UPI00131E4F80|nr:glycosyltransferase family 92 protein [Lunatibacter salilacus]
MQSLKKLLSFFYTLGQSNEENYFSICCYLKDENEYLKEWIDYHQKIGVEHFYLYDNGSKKPVRETIESLNYSSITTVIEIPGKEKHIEAYNHCLRYFGNKSRWIAFIDMDEFLVPKTDDSNLKKFMRKFEPYGGLGVTWLIFGSNGHKNKPHESQLEAFTMRSEVSFNANVHIKSIVQPRYVRSARISHCFNYKIGFHCVSENFQKIPRAVSPPSVDTIQLNHYYCRSLEEYHEKIQRGRGDRLDLRKLEDFHDHDRDSNVVEDRTILEIAKL